MAEVQCPQCGEWVLEDRYEHHLAVVHVRDVGPVVTAAHTGKLVAWLVFVIALTALGYASRLAGEEPPEDLAYRWSSSIGAAVQYGLMLGILLLIARGLPYRDVFALHRPQSWPRALGLSVVALLTIWLAGVALSPFLDANEEQGFVPDEWDSSRAGAFAAFFVTVAVVAPVVEELVYRGLGYSLLAPYGALTAIAVTGILFGASHGLVVALPILTVFGLAVGWLRMKTNSVYPSMLLHGVFNGVALIVSVALLD
jgi:membrane protease YdiL (CAAX protease family)